MAKLFESEAEAVDQLLLWNTMCSARAMIAVGGGGGGNLSGRKRGGKSWRAAVRERGERLRAEGTPPTP